MATMNPERFARDNSTLTTGIQWEQNTWPTCQRHGCPLVHRCTLQGVWYWVCGMCTSPTSAGNWRV